LPTKLTTTVDHIASIPNPENAALIKEFYKYMKNNDTSERHQNNNLKAITAFAKFLGGTSFYDIANKEQILSFLDTKANSSEEDPDRKWIVTWNDYLHSIKNFLRWLHNEYKGNDGKDDLAPQSEWITPAFVKIKEKKTKRLSPYSEDEIWEKDDLLAILKYEPYLRNKAALTLFWDLDARNHELTKLKIKTLD
jgi:integrase/recombinase XerD